MQDLFPLKTNVYERKMATGTRHVFIYHTRGSNTHRGGKVYKPPLS